MLARVWVFEDGPVASIELAREATMRCYYGISSRRSQTLRSRLRALGWHERSYPGKIGRGYEYVLKPNKG